MTPLYRTAGILAVLVACAAAFPEPMQSQSDGLDEVTYEIGAETFASAIPLDVPFALVGSADPNPIAICVTYYPKDYCSGTKKYRKRRYWDGAGDALTCSGTKQKYGRRSLWQRQGPKTFRLHLGPLHAETVYEFEFEYTVRVADALGETAVRDQLFAVLRASLDRLLFDNDGFTGPGTGSGNDAEILENEIQQTLRRLLIGSLGLNAPQVKRVHLNFSSEPYLGALTRLAEVSKDSRDAKTALQNSVEVLLRPRLVCGVGQTCRIDGVLDILEDVLDGTLTLSAQAEEWWNGALNPAREGLGETATKDAGRLFFEIVGRRAGATAILNGTARVKGSALEPSSGLDASSFSILADLLDTLASAQFTTQAGPPVITDQGPPGQGGLASWLRANVIAELRNVAAFVGDLAKAEERVMKARDELPSVFAGLLVDEQATVEAEPTFVGTDQHPYIGLDVGVGHAWELSETFYYTGANFYLAPVNKRAPLGAFQGRDHVFKRLGFLFGLTESVEDPSGITRDLFDGGNLVAGVGVRASRSFRLSLGVLLHKQADPSPLVTRERTTETIFGSFSFDIDLSKYLGRLAKLFPGD